MTIIGYNRKTGFFRKNSIINTGFKSKKFPYIKDFLII